MNTPMRAQITNFESSRNIPTRIGDVFFAAGETKEFRGAETIGEISKYPGISVHLIRDPRPYTAPDYQLFKINELRTIAKKKGITGSGRMTKKALVKILKETPK